MGRFGSKQSGLSWLDLGIVVFLLGIMAAIIIPRFMTLNANAHQANVEGTAQAFSAGLLKFTAQHKIQGKPSALPVTFPDQSTHYLIFSALGYPHGFGMGKSDYTLFDAAPLSEEACRNFFEVAIVGVDATAITKQDYIDGGRADYIALGYRTRVYGGCRYMYTKGQPSTGKIYAIYYDGNDGQVRVEIEDKPE